MLRHLACALLPVTIALAAGSESMPEPPKPAKSVPAKPVPKSAPSAESVYNEGLTLKAAGKWPEAEAAFREATQLKPDFPEAWSELGHARKKRGLYDESVEAYEEALRLRPAFPQAMEYLGEAYVYMGKRAEAQQLLDRLRPLDPALATQLEKALRGGGSGY